MLCSNCNSENPDGCRFCNHCGAPMISQQPENTPDDQQLLDRELNESAQLQPEFTLNTQGEPEEKRKLPRWVLIAAAAAAAVAILLLLLLLPGVRGFFQRSFLPARKLLSNAYCNAISQGVEKLDQAEPVVQKDGTTQLDAHFQVGDQVLSMVAGLFYSDADSIAPLSDIGLRCDVTRKDGQQMLDYTLALEDTEILTAVQYVDPQQGKMWVELPELNDQAVCMPYNDPAQTGAGELSGLASAELDIRQVEKVALRYTEMLVAALENVEKSRQAVELQDVSQKLTLLEGEISQRDFYELLIDIFNDMKINEDVLQIYDQLAQASGQGSAEEFVEQLDELIRQCHQEMEAIEDGNGFILRTYLNNKNKIVGIALDVTYDAKQHCALSYLLAVSGRDYALQLTVAEELLLEGGGRYDGGINGTFRLSYDGKELVEVEAMELLSRGNTSKGQLKITPSDYAVESLLEALDLDESLIHASRLLSIRLDMSWDNKKDQDSLQVSIMSGEAVLLGISVDAQQEKAQKITLPENAISADDDEAMEQWLEELQSDGLMTVLDRLGDAGVSQQLIGMLKLLLAF